MKPIENETLGGMNVEVRSRDPFGGVLHLRILQVPD
jgi:hypothetical protein